MPDIKTKEARRLTMSSNLITVKLGLHLEKFTLLVRGELVEYVRKLRWGLGDATSDGIADDIDYSDGKGNGAYNDVARAWWGWLR